MIRRSLERREIPKTLYSVGLLIPVITTTYEQSRNLLSLIAFCSIISLLNDYEGM
jgi:hypothetical protein